MSEAVHSAHRLISSPSKHSPGALRDPAPTDLLPAHGLNKLAMVFGLIMSGVSILAVLSKTIDVYV
jgi:hypothetical protein